MCFLSFAGILSVLCKALTPRSSHYPEWANAHRRCGGFKASLSTFEYIFRGIYIFSHSIFLLKIGFHLSVKLNEMMRVAADLANGVTLALSNEFCIVIFFCGYMFVCEDHRCYR